MKFEVPGGVGSMNGEPTLPINHTIGIIPEVLAMEDVTNWWWFNEALGSTAEDSIGDNDGKLLGGMKWSSDAIEETSVEFEKPSQMMDLGNISPDFNASLFNFLCGSKGKMSHSHGPRNKFLMLC